MSRNSMYGFSNEKEANSLLNKIRGNIAFLTQSDLKILRFLSTKGEFNELTPKLINNKSVPFVDEVEEFNTLMGKEWQNRKIPTINKEDAQFVIDFIQEELDELKESVEKEDIVGVLDALLDITYVGLGNGALVFGLKDKILPGYEEVQASNLSKICKTEDEAIETVKHVEINKGYPCYYKKTDKGYVVYRTSDNKVQKSIKYFSPNLKKLF